MKTLTVGDVNEEIAMMEKLKLQWILRENGRKRRRSGSWMNWRTDALLAENVKNGSVIPLRKIITNWGGPSMRSSVNLYYLHWWSLTHFLMEMYPAQSLALVQNGGDLAWMKTHYGSIDELEKGWHGHVRKLKQSLP